MARILREHNIRVVIFSEKQLGLLNGIARIVRKHNKENVILQNKQSLRMFKFAKDSLHHKLSTGVHRI